MTFFKRGMMVCLLGVFAITPSNSYSLLSSDNIKKYDHNSTLGEDLFSFGNFMHPVGSTLVPRAGDSSMGYYRGYTSYSAGESDIYAFNEQDGNTFIRFANFNGDSWGKDSKNTRMVFYWFNEEFDMPYNIPDGTRNVTVSFSYRLYASKEDQLLFLDDDKIIDISIRNSEYENTGLINFEQLIINEPGDDTWHTYTKTVDTYVTSSSNAMTIKFFYHEIAENNNPSFYFDMDNVTATVNGQNYVRNRGNFEEYKSINTTLKISPDFSDAFNNGLFYKQSLGKPAVVDRGLQIDALDEKVTFSLGVQEPLLYPKLRLSFDYLIEDEGVLTLLTNNQKIASNSIHLLNDEMIKSSVITLDNGYKNFTAYIDLYKIKDFSSLDFVYEEGKINIKNLTFNEILDTSITAGDYPSFKNEYDTIKEELGDYHQYVSISSFSIYQAYQLCDKINEYSSQSNIDYALSVLKQAKSMAIKKGDIAQLREYVQSLYTQIAGTNSDDYTTVSWINFRVAVENAYSLDENATAAEVSEAINQLNIAFNNLERRDV